jgi:soluble lytic murein transglycosylase
MMRAAPPLRVLLCMALAAATMPAGASSVATSRAPEDAALLDARAAYAEGDGGRLATDAPALVGTLFESYADYWQASLRLRGAVPDDALVAPFLARYNGTVLADRLRAEWLAVLAAHGDFATFNVERRRLIWGGDESQLGCWSLLARYATDEGGRREGIAREARRFLASSADPSGDGCTALADRLMDDGALGIDARLQVLVERRQIPAALKASARLSPADAAATARLLAHPAQWLAAEQDRLATMPHLLPLLAIIALSRESPERAAQYAELLDPGLGVEQRSLIWGRIGREAQYRLLPQANAWFERQGDPMFFGPDTVRPADLLESRARAALRRGAVALASPSAPFAEQLQEQVPDPVTKQVAEQGAEHVGEHVAEQGAEQIPALGRAPGPDWLALRKVIARMAPEQQADPTWVYWDAQALIALGRADEGRAALRSIADRFSYYGRLAAEALQLPATALPRPPAPPAAQVEELGQRPGLQRARKLFELGLREEATREWNWELRGMDDEGLHAAAELARRYGVLDRMIASSERTKSFVDLEQRYPMPYADLMAATTAPLGVDPAWIYGLIRQESRFMEDVRSNSGAIGLMQLMPATARFVAHRIGYEPYRADRVADVKVNLRLGTEYLKLVFDDQDGQPLLASAAYNAGPSRVRRWRAALARNIDGAIFVETIPINETRDYVRRVLFNTVVYAGLLNRAAPSLGALLAPVAPKAVPASELP